MNDKQKEEEAKKKEEAEAKEKSEAKEEKENSKAAPTVAGAPAQEQASIMEQGVAGVNEGEPITNPKVAEQVSPGSVVDNRERDNAAQPETSDLMPHGVHTNQSNPKEDRV